MSCLCHSRLSLPDCLSQRECRKRGRIAGRRKWFLRGAILDEVLPANAAYAEAFGDKAALALPPARSFAILTCMDARLDSAKHAGLAEGDAHVIRNASDDAIRSLVISYKLLETREWFIIHHTNCGMEFFDDTVIRGLLASSLKTARLGPDGFTDVGTGPGSTEGSYID